MQVSLDAIDWEQLISFPSAAEFLEWYYDLEDEEKFRRLSCYDHGWRSDSAIQYFEVAGVLEHLAAISEAETSKHLREGVQRLIAESDQIDEFAMCEPSEGCYWISACPATVVIIKSHLDAIDLNHCVALLSQQPPADAEEIMADLDGMFVSFIKQHSEMVDLAVSKGYGLLGHCG